MWYLSVSILIFAFFTSIYFNVQLIVLPNIFLSLMHLIWKTDSSFVKFLFQGILTMKKKMVKKLSFS